MMTSNIRKTAMAATAMLLLMPSMAMAQSKGSSGGPDYTLAPNYGEITLREGFTPDPYTRSISAGGNVQASAARSGCAGMVSRAPDLQVTYDTNGSSDLTFSADSNDDTTLLINGPNGNWYCDDDSGGESNPRLTISNAPDGRYDVWVGTYGNTNANAVLAISEIGEGAGYSSSSNNSSYSNSSNSSGPDLSAEPMYGSANLRAGFTPDPYTLHMTAGGGSRAATVREGCEGNVASAPDFQVFYEAGDYDLIFKAVSDSDTTLLINGPNGRWHCDDDSGGDLDPKVVISNPQSGRYDIWVGTYGADTVAATLEITELN